MKRIACLSLLAVCLAGTAYGQDNVVDEIVWVVGDEAILRSDVETQRLYMQNGSPSRSSTSTKPRSIVST